MLIEGLLNVAYTLFDLLTSPINLPSLPDGVATWIEMLCGYLATGVALLQNWTDLAYLLTLLGVVVAVDAGVLIYKTVMWFIRKIPLLGIE